MFAVLFPMTAPFCSMCSSELSKQGEGDMKATVPCFWTGTGFLLLCSLENE